MWRSLNNTAVVNGDSSEIVNEGVLSGHTLGEVESGESSSPSLGIGLGEQGKAGAVARKRGFGGSSAALVGAIGEVSRRRPRGSRKPRRKPSTRRIKRKRGGPRRKKTSKSTPTRRRKTRKGAVRRRRRSQKSSLLPGAIF